MVSGREYTSEKIRNVVLLGHGGSGKTSLVDALAFMAGTSNRRGSVKEGHALTLTTPEEVDHGISLQLTPAYAEWEGHKINLLDTPGYLDFTGEALAASRVADAAVIVVGATSGVEVGTERVREYCEIRGIPRIFYVSMMDKENADFEAVFEDIRERVAPNALPLVLPVGSGPDFRGTVQLIGRKARLYKEGSGTGEYEETGVPEEMEGFVEEWRTELLETLATTSEELLDRYLEGEEISREEVVEALATAMAEGDIVPVFCGSTEKGCGMRILLQGITELFPSPVDAVRESGRRVGLDQEVELEADDRGPFAALVFKTASEPHIGELSYFRVFSGMVVNGAEVRNGARGSTEKLNHLSIGLGKERFEVPRLQAGDIGVVAKLKDTHTSDTLCSPALPITLQGIDFPEPDIAVALRGVTRGDEDKLGEVLHKLEQEDPTFRSEFNPELGQTIAHGLGELHLEVQFERMKRKYGVSIETEPPKIAYRETITRQAQGRGRFKKQSGGRGQFGDCWLRLKPLPSGSGYEFIDSIKGGVIPFKFVPSVDRGIQEASGKGVLAGFPVVDFAAQVYDGSYHSVDSSDIAFKVAGSMAFRKVAQDAGPVLLEPIVQVKVETAEEYVGDIMGDLNGRRGRVQGMDSEGGRTVIRALVPEAELYKYAASLRSITHGRAHHSGTLAGYEPVPDIVARKVIAAVREEE